MEFEQPLQVAADIAWYQEATQAAQYHVSSPSRHVCLSFTIVNMIEMSRTVPFPSTPKPGTHQSWKASSLTAPQFTDQHEGFFDEKCRGST
jgi:hypothetical protein